MFRLKSAVRLPIVGRQKATVAAAAPTSTANVDPKSDDYQYLQKTTTPMLHFQPSLPRLPIPELEKTCTRYLAAQRPLLDDAAFRQTELLVADFRRTDGPKLQDLLKAKDKANKHTSYISEPWFNTYLSDRIPLPINNTPALLMKRDERALYNDQLIRTANLVISTLRFRRSLVTQMLKPEVYHMNAKKSDTDRYHMITRLAPARISTYVSYAFNAFPLDMSQYQGLFGATRIPENGKDRIYREPNTKHMAVVKNGNFYAIDVLDADGNIEQPEVILGRLQYVLASTAAPAEHPIGVLSSENRDTWAGIRQHLVNIGNESALRTIDSALFCLCLDETTLDENQPVHLTKDMLCGDATNRWFDKSLTLMVAKDGTTGVSFEHSWGDGVAVLRYFNEIYQDMQIKAFVHPETRPDASGDMAAVVRPIAFTLDDHAKQAIAKARASHAAITASLGLHFLVYYGMNKRVCKQYGLSPDSIMQLGFQLAFLKQYGKYVATYESCSTAAFRHGRTETIRPCTMATKAFCDAVTSASPPSTVELRAMIDGCSKAHGTLTKEAAMGQGFDRHLYGLRHIASEHGLGVSALFEDEAYVRINKNVMSTSTLASQGLYIGAFGPVVKDGYGIGYSIQDDILGAIVSSYEGHRDAPAFLDCLKSAYDDIKDVVDASPRKPN